MKGAHAHDDPRSIGQNRPTAAGEPRRSGRTAYRTGGLRRAVEPRTEAMEDHNARGLRLCLSLDR